MLQVAAPHRRVLARAPAERLGGIEHALNALTGTRGRHRLDRPDRLQRVASEVAKRETVYADFVMSASNLLLNAYTKDEIASGAYELALNYSKERKAFGEAIMQHQAIQFKLADMATRIEASRLLCLRAAWEKAGSLLR